MPPKLRSRDCSSVRSSCAPKNCAHEIAARSSRAPKTEPTLNCQRRFLLKTVLRNDSQKHGGWHPHVSASRGRPGLAEPWVLHVFAIRRCMGVWTPRALQTSSANNGKRNAPGRHGTRLRRLPAPRLESGWAFARHQRRSFPFGSCMPVAAD